MFDINDLAFANSKPTVSGVFKTTAEDFKVNELLSFDFTGSGEHVFLRIEKQGLNTEDLIKQVAKALNKSTKDIAYAGLKDRLALTTQWLSIQCPGEDLPAAHTLMGDGWRVVQAERHLKKLKASGLLGNQFTLVLRDIVQNDETEARLHHILAHGVPNYFGPQRFGHQGQNLVKARNMLIEGYRIKDRFLRGLYYSTARSFLFNRILSARVTQKNWDQAIPGDVMQLSGSHSIFPIDVPDEAIVSRVAEHDLSPASLLSGKGQDLVSAQALTIQQDALQGFEEWCDALARHDLEKAYRANVLHVLQFSWDWQDNTLHLSFELPPGAYATSVLRELIIC